MTQPHLLNAIPGAMIPQEGITLTIIPIPAHDVPDGVPSAIGHADTAAKVSALLGREVPVARISVPAMAPGEAHYLALYQAKRLDEGVTTLPMEATLGFYVMYATGV